MRYTASPREGLTAVPIGPSHKMSKDERRVIFASSLGTIFEWYDFFLYGALAAHLGAAFFGQYGETTRNIFALLTFAAGFLVRPFGALVFGRMGDLLGRKHTFLVTIVIMGTSTFLVGLLPGADAIGIAAPILLVSLRMLQGLALGGEFGGAATSVAEHAPDHRRGFYTSWIQTTASLGLLLSLLIIYLVRTVVGSEAFALWGWRIPFLLSSVLLGISVWIRLIMKESPAFEKMREENALSKAPLTEAFGNWANLRISVIALFGIIAGLTVTWHSSQFYSLFFLQTVLKVEVQVATTIVATALILGAGSFVFFGWLSDKLGRKPLIVAGMALSAICYFPLFHALTLAANPALAQAQKEVRTQVTAAPGDCTFQFDPAGLTKFTTSCDIATTFLSRNAIKYSVVMGGPGTGVSVSVDGRPIASFDAGVDKSDNRARFEKAVGQALQSAGYPLVRANAIVPDSELELFADRNPELRLDVRTLRAPEARLHSVPTNNAVDGVTIIHSIPGGGVYNLQADTSRVDWVSSVAILWVLVVLAAMVYGPSLALLVEMYPARIRYSGMSLPFHLGNGWFGGLLPAAIFAMNTAVGDIYYGLWYPIIAATASMTICLLFVRETLGTDIDL